MEPKIPKGINWVEIPRSEDWNFIKDHPSWLAIQNQDGKALKPLIRCRCGRISGIGLHHVLADGRVWCSFYHKKGTKYPEDPDGCEWHVFLKLLDYDQGEFPPE